MKTSSRAQLDIESPLAMALAYAAHGWPVFPLYTVKDGACTCYKRAACQHPGKHPRITGGFLNATTDLEKIAYWFGMWPESNIGIATGVASGIVVIDIDPRNGGHDTVLALADEGKTFARTAQVLTQSGGFHLYYRHPGGKVKSVSNGCGPGIDVKADGGYVVAPPSVGVLGAYVWQVAPQELAAL